MFLADCTAVCLATGVILYLSVYLYVVWHSQGQCMGLKAAGLMLTSVPKDVQSCSLKGSCLLLQSLDTFPVGCIVKPQKVKNLPGRKSRLLRP